MSGLGDARASGASVQLTGASVEQVCTSAIDLLMRHGIELSSVYLRRGDRLRCLGVAGYGQLYDGIPVGIGVIGSVLRSGRPMHVRPQTGDAGYRPAASGVVEELALPLFVDGTCVGVLNVEGQQPLTARQRAVTEQVWHVLERRLQELGGPPPESSAQRLVRVATEMATCSSMPALADVLLARAVELSGLDSAFLVVGRPPRVMARTGPAADGLARLTPEALEGLLPWVLQGGSSRTSADRRADPTPVQQALAAAGMRTFVLVPVGERENRVGVLVTGTARTRTVRPRTVEHLELLAALAAADFTSLRAGELLRRQASIDPLTGLANRSTFGSAVEAALDEVRASGARRSLALIDVDGFKQVNDARGHLGGDRLLCDVSEALARVLRREDRLYRLGGDEFAALLRCERDGESAVLADRLLASTRRTGVTVSIGLTALRSGDGLDDVVGRADAALYAAKGAGRDRRHTAEAPS